MLLPMQKIALLIPCYNEEFRLQENHVASLLEETTIAIYFLNDGSTDNTGTIIEKICNQYPNNCLNINYKKNEGKAAVLYKSIREISTTHNYDYIGYFDADFSTPPTEIKRLVNSIITSNYQFVIGSRILLLNANIKRRWYRHIIGRIILTLINFKHHLDIYDTQCGAKIFSKEIIDCAFEQPFKTSWLFDTEIFIRLKQSNVLQKGKEIPLEEWTDYGGSKLSWKSSFKILKELLIILKE